MARRGPVEAAAAAAMRGPVEGAAAAAAKRAAVGAGQRLTALISRCGSEAELHRTLVSAHEAQRPPLSAIHLCAAASAAVRLRARGKREPADTAQGSVDGSETDTVSGMSWRPTGFPPSPQPDPSSRRPPRPSLVHPATSPASSPAAWLATHILGGASASASSKRAQRPQPHSPPAMMPVGVGSDGGVRRLSYPSVPPPVPPPVPLAGCRPRELSGLAWALAKLLPGDTRWVTVHSIGDGLEARCLGFGVFPGLGFKAKGL